MTQKHFAVTPTLPRHYGSRIFIHEDNFSEVVEILNEHSIWGGADKHWDCKNGAVLGWEFSIEDPAPMQKAMMSLTALGFSKVEMKRLMGDE